MEEPIIPPNIPEQPRPLMMITPRTLVSMVPKKAWTILGVLVATLVLLGLYKLFPAQTPPLVQTQLTDKVIPPIVAVPSLSVVKSAKLGNYLVGKNGMTLYRYTKDADGVSNCSGDCATNWPPYVFTSEMSISNPEGVKGKIGIIARGNGVTQMTYNGAPLYFFAKDTNKGDVTGQNVGKVWFIVKP